MRQRVALLLYKNKRISIAVYTIGMALQWIFNLLLTVTFKY